MTRKASRPQQAPNVIRLASAPKSKLTPESLDVLRSLRELISSVEEGRVDGFIYLAIGPSGEYSGDCLGQVRNHPIFCRGLIQALDDIVRQKR